MLNAINQKQLLGGSWDFNQKYIFTIKQADHLLLPGKQDEGSKHDCWSVACSDDGEVVVGGFSNGDVRMFDLRQTKGCLWGTELPGGIASLSLDMDEGLVASTVQGGLHLWDLATKHPIHGYCRTDTKLEKSCVWRALPCPQADNVLATALQSGALQLATYQRPDTRFESEIKQEHQAYSKLCRVPKQVQSIGTNFKKKTAGLLEVCQLSIKCKIEVLMILMYWPTFLM